MFFFEYMDSLYFRSTVEFELAKIRNSQYSTEDGLLVYERNDQTAIKTTRIGGWLLVILGILTAFFFIGIPFLWLGAYLIHMAKVMQRKSAAIIAARRAEMDAAQQKSPGHILEHD